MNSYLVETNDSLIVYGDFRGEYDVELFRTAKGLYGDLKEYINRNRALVAPNEDRKIPYIDDDTEDLRNVEGKEMIAYWRMYFRDGCWAGRWMVEHKAPDNVERAGAHVIEKWFWENFPKGCNWKMENFFIQNEFKPRGDGKRYLIKPYLSEYYKVMVDTTYGNGDYPVRIYVYRDKEQ